MICVYDIGNTNYDGNGNAVLTPTEAKMKSAAGGNYDMTMTHPIDPDGKWKHLVPGAVIRCPVPREEIENAFAGYEADVYKTTVNAELREGPSEPTYITYSAWNSANDYSVGDKVTFAFGVSHKNYQCVYFDAGSAAGRIKFPPSSDWWTPIPDMTAGSPVLVTLPAGTELYLVEDYNTNWYKMSTYYGIVGYVKKSVVTYYKHLTPSETLPRIITTQLMRITNATVDTKNRTVSVTAQHISYDLNGIIVDSVALNQASPAMAIGRIAEAFMIPYSGTIATNLTEGTYTDTIKGKTGMYCLLDPDKGIVSQFDAAFKRDNWDLFIMQRTAQNRGFRLKYRKNMIGVNWSKKSDSLITRIVPVAKDANGDDLLLPEKWVDSAHINDYPIIRMERLSVAGQVGKDKGAGDGSTWTEADLLDEMRAKAEEQFTVYKVDVVLQDVTVDFEMIGNTAEYAWLKGLESVLLYDTVSVENEEVGLDMDLTVTELEWDAIREKIVALKLSNANEKAGRNVTGYNVQAKSIGPNKLTDEVAGEIISQVKDIIPEYADPQASRPATVSVTDGDPTLAWGTRSAVGTVQGTDLHVTMPADPASGKVSKAGDTMSGALTINNNITANKGNYAGTATSETADSNLFTAGAFEIREAGRVANAQSSAKYAPRIGFHWSMRCAGSVALENDAKFHFKKQNGTDKATIVANIEGDNVSSANYSLETIGALANAIGTITTVTGRGRYADLPGGLRIQWGNFDSYTNTKNRTTAITFPVEFSTGQVYVFATAAYSSDPANYGGAVVSAYGISKTGCTIAERNLETNYLRGFSYIAIGPK